MFYYVLFKVPLIFHYFIFLDKVALWPISYAVETLGANMLRAKEPDIHPGTPEPVNYSEERRTSEKKKQLKCS